MYALLDVMIWLICNYFVITSLYNKLSSKKAVIVISNVIEENCIIKLKATNLIILKIVDKLLTVDRTIQMKYNLLHR